MHERRAGRSSARTVSKPGPDMTISDPSPLSFAYWSTADGMTILGWRSSHAPHLRGNYLKYCHKILHPG